MKKIPYYNGSGANVPDQNRSKSPTDIQLWNGDHTFYEHRETHGPDCTDLVLRTSYGYALSTIFSRPARGPKHKSYC